MKGLRTPLVTASLMLVLLMSVSLWGSSVLNVNAHNLVVSFLDVGQGDASFIESPSGMQVLIDGGKGSMVLGALQQRMGFFDRTIDMVIATHPDMDHIGGLADVFERYKVNTILITENISHTAAFQNFIQHVHDEGAQVIYARRGQVYDLGAGTHGSTTLSILFPDHDPTSLESNASSIVTRLVYGKSEFVFTGDSPQMIEKYLVSLDGTALQSDVLKLGHHGSRTSSSEEFISAINPEVAIISAGKNNSYGHPHKEVTDLLSAHQIIQKNTAEVGSIVMVSDGTQLWFK